MIENMGPTCIKIMTPCHGGQLSVNFSASLLDLLLACLQRNIRLDWDLRDGGADIARARTQCVAAFLADPEATHLMFIDADIGFTPEQVFRLLDFGVEFAAGSYPLKALDWDRIAKAVHAGDTNLAGALYYAVSWGGDEIAICNDFARIPYVGMGFVLIRRSALMTLSQAYSPARLDSSEAGQAGGYGRLDRSGLFDPIIVSDTGRYLSECFAFCQRWADLGGEIWLDVRSKLTHVGPMLFPGDLFSQLEQVPENSIT
jgi:hypothetical protein